MTTKEAAKIIGVTVGQVRAMIRAGRLRAERVEVSNIFHYWEILDSDVRKVVKENQEQERNGTKRGRRRGYKVNGVSTAKRKVVAKR